MIRTAIDSAPLTRIYGYRLIGRCRSKHGSHSLEDDQLLVSVQELLDLDVMATQVWETSGA